MSASTAPAWTPEGTFAERLALIRIHHGWNVKQAAMACGIAPATWRTWERGNYPQHVDEKARQIAKAAGVDYVWLMTGSTPPTQAKGHPLMGRLGGLPLRRDGWAA